MIRPEDPGYLFAIERMHRRAFGRQDEAVLVNELRDSGGLAVSLVAEVEGQVTGHIALSPMTFDVYPTSTRGYGLGPVAVLPDYQRMVIELKKGTLANYHGYARYHPAFHEVE